MCEGLQRKNSLFQCEVVLYIRFIIRLLRTVGTSRARIYNRTAKYRVGKIQVLQRCRQIFKSGWASSNAVGIICRLVVIGLTKLPNSGWAKAHPAHPLAAALNRYHVNQLHMKQLEVISSDHLQQLSEVSFLISFGILNICIILRV